MSKMMPRSGDRLCWCLHPYQFHLRPRLGIQCVGNWTGKRWLGPVDCDCMLFLPQTEEKEAEQPNDLTNIKLERLSKARQLLLGFEIKHKRATSHK